MKLRLVLLAILAVAFIVSIVLEAPARDVRAAGSDNCTAYINGKDVSSYNTPDNALEVDFDEVVTVSLVAPAPFVSHKVDVAWTDLFAWTASEEVDTGTQNSYSDEVHVADYAKYGMGLYKITASGVLQNGDTPSGVVFIKVVGKSPLSTVAGIVALVAAVGGLLALLLVVLLIWLGYIGSPSWFGCLGALPLAVLLTPLAMVMGGGQEPSSGDGETTGAEGIPPVSSGSQDASGGGAKFRLKISLLAIGCALLSAIGFVVLFQQMGVMYPTITVVVVSLVLGLLAGIVLPTLAATFSRRRKQVEHPRE